MSENIKETGLQIESVLDPNEIQITDLNGRPTISIEDGLTITRAVETDIPKASLGYGIAGHWLVPTRDLSELVIAHPFAGYSANPENWDGLDYVRAVGQEYFTELATQNGFEDFWTWKEAQKEAQNEQADTYWHLFDGDLAFSIDVFGSKDKEQVPSWQDLLAKYGADDPIVTGYLERVNQSVRVDAAGLFKSLSPLLLFVEEANVEKYMAVTRKLNTFLMEAGYKPEPSGFAVVDLDSGRAFEPEVNEAGDEVLKLKS